MMAWLKSLDRILRGDVTKPEAIREGSIDLPLRGLTIVIVVLAMAYGACMGTFALFREIDPEMGTRADRFLQILASTVKVPALFLLTLLVTFPSLYVFNALVGSRLNLVSMLRLLIASLAVNLAVLASLGPITAFFSVSTTSYRFMQLFNVVIFGISGTLGLLFLNQTLNRMSQKRSRLSGKEKPEPVTPEVVSTPEPDEASDASGPDELDASKPPAPARTPEPGALDRVEGHMLSRHVQLVFRIWTIAFCLVGAQMGWVLRPFIGSPDQPFTWFRQRQSNFFEAVLHIIGQLLTG